MTERLSDTVARHFSRFVSHMEPRVFLPAAALVILFVLAGVIAPGGLGDVFGALQDGVTRYLGWLYVFVATTMVGFVLALAASPLGRLRLGAPDSRPRFSRLSWFTMMLSAGMGIGIVYFGLVEPLEHFLTPPSFAASEASEGQRMRTAMATTFFHWGLHPWAVYAAVALPLAFLHFRHGLPLAPRVMLYPLIGDRIYGWIGHVVDTIATVGTLFGVATSLGLGAQQINAGLSRLLSVEQGLAVQLAIIAAITLAATGSVVSGLDRGIRRLSELNLALLVGLLAFVLVTGPTLFQIELFVSSLGAYAAALPQLSFFLELGAESPWQSDWTLFYWSWWISWSPFVGVFVARISEGRTVREFILAAMIVPSMLGFLWFSVMGGAGLREAQGSAGFADDALQNTALSLFTLLDTLPLAGLTSLVALTLVVVFFVTSSDSGSFVDDMVTSGGDPNPPGIQRVFWAVSEGAVAATLLLAGGLQALRTVSLTVGLPMACLLPVAAVGLYRALRAENQRIS